MQDIQTHIEQVSIQIQEIQNSISQTIVGQHHLIRNMVISLLARWHLLVEWAPWLAKTLSVETLAKNIWVDFSRIQCTPDLLPSDLIGTEIRQSHKNTFVTVKGPIFAHLVLVDEVNRAPAKLQSALLESMEERQVTIGNKTYILAEPFVVMATMNPVDHDGTYKLPQAQLDRFLMHTKLEYPTTIEEIEILKRFWWKSNRKDISTASLHGQDILDMQQIIDQVLVSESIHIYIQKIVSSTRPHSSPVSDLSRYIQKYVQYGASPRASLWILKAAKVIAVMNQRAFVIPEDIQSVVHDVLRHRLVLTFDALSESVSSDDIVHKLISEIVVIK